MKGDNDQIRRMELLLKRFEPLLAELKARRRRTAERFNVFEALRVDGYEEYHSRFIAYLLDPTTHHDQGAAFLISFLQYLGLSFSSTQGARVKPEKALDSDGRIDIRIRLANGQIILIENKVKAPEDTDQIARYQEWLRGQDAPPGFPHQLVFLTPEGRRPVSTRKPEEVVCRSYLQLADWLSRQAIAIEAEGLRVILEQYAELCRRIGGATDKEKDMTLEDERIRFYLENREQIEELEELVKAPRKFVCEFAHKFYVSLLDDLRDKAREYGTFGGDTVETEFVDAAKSPGITLRRPSWPQDNPSEGDEAPIVCLEWKRAEGFGQPLICGVYAHGPRMEGYRPFFTKDKCSDYSGDEGGLKKWYLAYKKVEPPHEFWKGNNLEEYGNFVIKTLLQAWSDLAPLVDEAVSQSNQ